MMKSNGMKLLHWTFPPYLWVLPCVLACCSFSPSNDERDGYDHIDGLPPLSIFEHHTFQPFQRSCQRYAITTSGPRLILQPVTLRSRSVPNAACLDVGVDNLRIWLFRDNQLVSDIELPCNCDLVDLGTIEPGDVHLALLAESENGTAYVAGLILVEGEYVPEYQHCKYDSVYKGCHPIDVTVDSTSVTVIPVELFCHDMLSGGPDTCGGP